MNPTLPRSEFSQVLGLQILLFAMRSSLLRAVLRPPTQSNWFASFGSWTIDYFKVKAT